MRAHLIPVHEVTTREEVLALARAVHRRRDEINRSGVAFATNVARQLAERDAMLAAERAEEANTNAISSYRKSIKHSRDMNRAEFIRYVLAWVSRRSRISVDKIIGRRRDKNIARARYLAIRIIKHHRRTRALTLGQVGQCFGGRDHSTIICAIRGTSAAKYTESKHSPKRKTNGGGNVSC